MTNKVKCQGCGKEVDYGNTPEVAMGAIICPHCGATIDQTGKVLRAKLSSALDKIASHLESLGMVKEAHDLDVVSNTLEATSSLLDEAYIQRVLPENIRIALSDLLQESLDMDNSSAYRASVATLKKYPEIARTLGDEVNKVMANKKPYSSHPETLGTIKKANEKPSIFTYTTYRDPTDEELVNVNNSDLPAKEVLHGFYYTIVGRGFLGEENKQQIVNAIDRLCKMYPDNKEYKTALDNAKELKPKF
jgi:DNA-directed RNA polymerase subunit RPC12/RpoP